MSCPFLFLLRGDLPDQAPHTAPGQRASDGFPKETHQDKGSASGFLLVVFLSGCWELQPLLFELFLELRCDWYRLLTKFLISKTKPLLKKNMLNNQAKSNIGQKKSANLPCHANLRQMGNTDTLKTRRNTPSSMVPFGLGDGEKNSVEGKWSLHPQAAATSEHHRAMNRAKNCFRFLERPCFFSRPPGRRGVGPFSPTNLAQDPQGTPPQKTGLSKAICQKSKSKFSKSIPGLTPPRGAFRHKKKPGTLVRRRNKSTCFEGGGDLQKFAATSSRSARETQKTQQFSKMHKPCKIFTDLCRKTIPAVSGTSFSTFH